MTDSSDCESDAGASPSVTSDESEDSTSSSSSTPALKIVCEPRSTPRKRNSTTNETPGTSSSTTLLSSPVSTSSRKPTRRQILESLGSSIVSPSTAKVNVSRVSQTAAAGKVTTTSTPTASRKRRRLSHSSLFTSPEKCEQSADPSMSPNTKRKRNKRRRTRSERNIRSGKGVTLSKTQIPAEGEVAVALDAEIDRVLEEKAIKNNLSATNVKSIIRHVITNNMVQKMIMSTMRKKVQTGEGGEGGCSSDEDGLLEPKMTRAKTKELLGNKQTPLWPIVDSPMKKNVTVSETHMLIHNDLPEDSSGDEYLPKDTDIVHSDDESSSVASVTSDVGSPAVSIGVSTRRSLQAERSPFSDPLFKTPPPPPKAVHQRREESAISRRTRSKLPLNDTPLEDLERQLVPPDITNDMYDWGETDNEDYLAFLKDFLFPGQNIGNEMGDDDEADPEYNVMEDDEDVHDKEELRMDRAVKVPKKELNELVAELIEEYHVSSGDDLEDHDITSLTSIMPFINDSGIYSDGHALESGELHGQSQGTVASTSSKKPENSDGCNGRKVSPLNPENSFPIRGLQEQSQVAVPIPDTPIIASKTICRSPNEITSVPKQSSLMTTTVNEIQKESSEEFEFRECDLKFLQHQMRQHIQQLAQSYVLTVSNEDSCLKHIATTSKRMIIELKNFALANGANSNFAVCSLEPAWNLVNYWPHKFLQQSPIKKKILEEKYITESCVDEGKNGNHYFPRHVVKIIAENPTFLYNNLLPENYHQKIIDNRRKFTTSEDALIVGALDEFKSITPAISVSQFAAAISDVLLPARPPTQVYHRIRNLRRVTHYCDPTIKRYFSEGILPTPDRTVPEIKFMLPLLQRDRTGVSLQWQSLLQHVEDSSTFGWEKRLNKDPVTKSLSIKNKKSKLNKMKVTESQKSNCATVKMPSIKTTFPNGAIEIEKVDPSVEAIPLMNANGKTGAIIYIPKYAMNPAHIQYTTPRKAYIFEPREGQEAEKESGKQELPSSSVKVLELNHLLRKSRETPLKRNSPPRNDNSPQLTESADGHEASLSERSHRQAKLATTTEVTNSNGMYQLSLQENIPARNFVAVGKPFDLPELNFSGMAGNGIINLTALETPMKRVVFEKVSEQASPQPASGEKFTPLEDEESCNVIEEGTEFELTSDSESEDGVDLQCYEEPELVALSSDEDVVKSEPMEGGGDARGSKSDSSPKKTEGNSGSKQNHATSSASTSNPACSRRTTRVGRGDDSDEEHNKPPRKRPLPEDTKDDNNSKEEDSGEKDKNISSHTKRHSTSSGSGANAKGDAQSQPHSSAAGNVPQPSSSKSQKKVRRSPGNQGSRRVSNYNVTPEEKMLEEEPNDFDDVADAYMESYLAKVHSVTETKHPGLYATFIQILFEAGEKAPVNQAELHAKVKVLLKDYPDLLKEFESFLDPSLNQTPENSTIVGASGHELVALSSGVYIVSSEPIEGGGDGRGSKSDSPPKKTEGSTKSGDKQSHATSSASTSNQACPRRTLMRVGRGDDSDEEHNKPPRKRPLPEDTKDDNNSKEEDSGEKDKNISSHTKRHSTSSGSGANAKGDAQSQPHSSAAGNVPQPSSSKSQKKVRRSPGNQGSRRVSKYNVTPAEKMLEEEPNDFDDVADAYMDSYLAKVHSVTEKKHPGLHATLIKMLIEAGEKIANQAERQWSLHAKVKVLFKDYPDLLKEFESFLDPTLNQTPENSTIDGTSGHEETLLNMRFIQQFEKFTENCPNQKTKVMNKLKSLKECAHLTEKDIAAALEPCFIGNPVMMDSFKALFQSIYRPQSVSLGMDFEEMEDPHIESNDDLHFETVKLPEETALPATNTCPCSCHLNTSDTAFTTRSKHCKNCSLKFQDGKIFIHNGKVLRPVSVELSPLHPTPKPSSTSTTPVRGCNNLNLEKVEKEPVPHTAKSKEFKEPEVYTKSTAQGDKKMNVQHTQVTQGQSTSSIKQTISTRDVHIEGEHPESDQRSKLDDSTKNPPGTPDASKSSKCRQTSRQDLTKQDMTEWTEEEDTIILSAFQQEPIMQIAWRKMASLMPHRPLDQIKSRCSELIAVLQSVSDEDNPG